MYLRGTFDKCRPGLRRSQPCSQYNLYDWHSMFVPLRTQYMLLRLPQNISHLRKNNNFYDRLYTFLLGI